MAQFQLRPYQIEDLALYMEHDKFMNLSDPGTGKTPSVCVRQQQLWQDARAKSIWQMPKSLLRKNKRELLAFTDLAPEQIQIVDGTPDEREKQLSNGDAVTFLMGFQRFADDWEKILHLHPEIQSLVTDEWHMGGFKNPNSKRSIAVNKFARRTKYFLPMSGTLIAGKLDSCFTAVNIIEPRYYGNHFSFMAQHAVKDDFGNLIGWINHDKIGRIFMRHGVRHTFEEVYGKEAKVIVKEKIEPDDKSLKAYKEFEEMAILELDGVLDSIGNPMAFLEGSNAAVAAMRCRQILAHPHKFNILKEDELTAKDEALLVHIEDHLNTKKPLVIFSAHVAEQERIYRLCLKMGLRTGLINNTVTSDKRGQIDEDFQNGLLDCVVGSPATAAVGFNWGHVDHVIFISIDYQDDNFVQAYRRAIREARKTHLLITVFEYIDTIERRVFRIVDAKSREKAKVDPTYEILTLSSI